MSDRRSFLRNLGLVSLPLIGGGVTLIGRPAAPVPLMQAMAAPALVDDPRQRARYAWEAFSSAMRDITTNAHGWYVQGGQHTVEIGYMKATPSWCRPQAVYFEPMFPDRPNFPGLTDRYEEIDVPGLSSPLTGGRNV